MDFTHRKKGRPDFLRRHIFAALALQAQRLLIVGDGGVEGANGDAEVIDARDHGAKMGGGKGRKLQARIMRKRVASDFASVGQT